jgi:hypothetical protein
LPGLIFTCAWAFDLPSEAETLEQYAAPFRRRGGRVLFTELQTNLEERLRRNESATRLAEKPSKRSLELSRRRLLEHERTHAFRSGDEFLTRADWLRVENSELEAAAAAELIVRHFDLPRLTL